VAVNVDHFWVVRERRRARFASGLLKSSLDNACARLKHKMHPMPLRLLAAHTYCKSWPGTVEAQDRATCSPFLCQKCFALHARHSQASLLHELGSCGNGGVAYVGTAKNPPLTGITVPTWHSGIESTGRQCADDEPCTNLTALQVKMTFQRGCRRSRRLQLDFAFNTWNCWLCLCNCWLCLCNTWNLCWRSNFVPAWPRCLAENRTQWVEHYQWNNIVAKCSASTWTLSQQTLPFSTTPQRMWHPQLNWMRRWTQLLKSHWMTNMTTKLHVTRHATQTNKN